MIFQTWGEVFASSLQNIWSVSAEFFFLKLIPAIIIFILGWVIGQVIETAIKELFKAVKIDNLADKVGLHDTFKKADWDISVGGVVGGALKWLLVIVVLGVSLNLVGLPQVGEFFSAFILGYLPNVIIAVFILVIAAYGSHFVGKLVSGSSKLAGVKGGDMIASLSRYAIWVFAFILAFDHLEILPGFSTIILSGFVAMIAIAAGLAFGLGGRDAAARAIESIGHQMKGTQK